MQQRNLIKRFAFTSALLALGCAAGGVYELYGLYAEVRPTIQALPALPPRAELTSEVFDRHEAHLADLSGDKRYLVRYQELPAHLVAAFLSAEDKYFFEHSGINPLAIARAVWINAWERRWVQGASTITQQLSRILFLSQEKSLRRKVKEVFLTLALERCLDKRQILTLYLNSIYFGNHAYGIEAAARRYFGKAARDLDLAESALLAGVVRAPSYYAPHRHWHRAKARQLFVLEQMHAGGFISRQELGDWREVSVGVKAATPVGRPGRFGFIRDAIVKELSRKFELRRSGDEGLRIETSFDRSLQLAAEQTLLLVPQPLSRAHPTSPAIQAALISLDAESGAIVAMQGSTSYDASQFNRALHTERPMAGLVLPFVLAAALEQGYHALTPLTPRESFYDTFLRQDLDAALPMLALVGSGNVQLLASQLGLKLPNELSPTALGLGQGKASPLAVALAFSAFFNRGRRPSPYAITHLANAVGQSLYRKAPAVSEAVLRQESAYIVQELLKINHRRGHLQAIPAYHGGELAGMITASADLKNGWFAGATGRLVHVLWIGGEFERHQIAESRQHLFSIVGSLVSHYLRSGKSALPAFYPFSLAPAGRVSFARLPLGSQKQAPRVLVPFATGSEPRTAQY